MRVIPTAIPEVKIIEPRVHADARGEFHESYNEGVWREQAGIAERFVQDNHSRSVRHVLRGLHYQLRRVQGKLVRAATGAVFDVAVDMRRSAPTFGRWVGVTLSADDHRQLWIPGGFAHGFLVLSERADVLYKTTDFYSPADERCLAWDDPDVAVDWPLEGAPILSEKDRAGARLADAERFP